MSPSTGPASVAQVIREFEDLAANGRLVEFQPLPTGFSPLDEVLNGGIRPGELAVLGGPYGVGKTVLGLQIARNVVRADERNRALYVCYEHDRTHLLSRLLCLESAEQAVAHDGRADDGGADDGGADDARQGDPPGDGGAEAAGRVRGRSGGLLGVLRKEAQRADADAPIDGWHANAAPAGTWRRGTETEAGARADVGGSGMIPVSDDRTLTLRKLTQLMAGPEGAAPAGAAPSGRLFSTLRHDARYAPLLRALAQYGDRLILARASGTTTTLDEIRQWIELVRAPRSGSILVIIDYLQKIAVDRRDLRNEEEATTYLMHGLKELALAQRTPVIAIAAADRGTREGQRMRLSDLRGSSAMQFETDIGLVLNNKYDIVSREHLIYNVADAEAMRTRVVLSIEKNRAGRHAVDMEFAMDAPHFRFDPTGDFVRERLIDGKVVVA